MSLASTLLAACIAVAGCTESQPPERVEQEQLQSAAGEELASRMRRLHLVRPDLLPYPLAFEVYC